MVDVSFYIKSNTFVISIMGAMIFGRPAKSGASISNHVDRQDLAWAQSRYNQLLSGTESISSRPRQLDIAGFSSAPPKMPSSSSTRRWGPRLGKEAEWSCIDTPEPVDKTAAWCALWRSVLSVITNNYARPWDEMPSYVPWPRDKL